MGDRMIVRCIVVGVSLIVASASPALAAGGEYFTDSKSRCKLWWPTKEPYYDEGKIVATYTILSVKWTGTCGKGMAQGRGTFEVAEKYVYEGEKPRVTTSRGEGEFVDGKLTGRGFYVDTYDTEAGSLRTEGEFRDGVLNGKGFTVGDGPTYK